MTTTTIAHRPGSLRATTQYDYILLDGSSSMMSKWYETLSAIQSYVDAAKQGNVHSRVLLHVFDSNNADYIAREAVISDWTNLRDDAIGSTWGSTPLYDAITLMGRRLRDLDPPRASIVIVTDGDENGSRFTNLTQAKSILDWCRAKGWQVTFIGADFNNSEQSRALGANEHTAIGVQQRKLTDAASALGRKRARYGLYGEGMDYTRDEQVQFGGFLSAPGATS